jgi:hypothetical protein
MFYLDEFLGLTLIKWQFQQNHNNEIKKKKKINMRNKYSLSEQ